jgi:hypothetical protein
MNAVRGLLRDLVERRLWPVALLLVAALVAVPVYLGRSSSEGNVAPPAATAQARAPASKAAVTLESDAPDESTAGGHVSNPFKQQHVPKPAATTGAGTGGGSTSTTDTTPATGTTGGSGGATTPSTGGGSTPSTGGGSTPPTGDGSTTPSPSTSTKDPLVSHVTLRLGALGALTTFKDVARLSALPSAAEPQFVFTGVLQDGKTAVLLPSSEILISEESDVKCKPSNKNCQTLEVAEGDTVFFKLLGDDQGVQYQLDVVSVHPKAGGSSNATAAALRRHSKAGSAMLRDARVKGRSAFQGAVAYRWLPDQGVLVRTPQHSKAHASANGAAAASSDDAVAALPGLPVWHSQPGA